MKYPVILLLSLVSVSAMAADAKTGERLFNSRACIGCHAIGRQGGGTTGPNLSDVTRRRNEQWLRSWLAAPDHMKDDAIVKGLKTKYQADMPNLGLNPDETQSLILFLKSKDDGK